MTEQDCEKRNVLISVDGSDHSQRAFDYYLNEHCKANDHVIVFNAQEMPAIPVDVAFSAGIPYTHEELRDVAQKCDAEAKALLRHYGDSLKKKTDITFKLIKEGGPPGPLIVRNAQEEKAKTIVMGTRGQGTLRRTILGSVSDYVLHHSHIPVCIIPPPDNNKSA